MSTATLREMATNFMRLKRFDGMDFRRWQKKLFFLLSTVKVAYVLTTPRPEEDDEPIAQTRTRQKWDEDDNICRGNILNGMSDALFDVYQNVKTAKELWEDLEEKYKSEDATSKKFLVSKLNNYKMVDSRSVLDQLHEIQHILNQFTQHNMNMDECIVVASIIDKLPPSWKDFKKSLEHRKEKITFKDLANHLRIEEECRMQDARKEQDAQNAKVYVMEDEYNKTRQSTKENRKRAKHPINHNTIYKNDINIFLNISSPVLLFLYFFFVLLRFFSYFIFFFYFPHLLISLLFFGYLFCLGLLHNQRPSSSTPSNASNTLFIGGLRRVRDVTECLVVAIIPV